MDKEKDLPKSFKIVISLIIGFCILFLLVLATMVYIASWTSTSPPNDLDPLDVEGSINSSNRSFEVMVFEDRIDWRDHEVRVDNLILSPSINVSNKGDTLIFNNPDWDPLPNTTYKIQIVDNVKDLYRWEEFIIAT